MSPCHIIVTFYSLIRKSILFSLLVLDSYEFGLNFSCVKLLAKKVLYFVCCILNVKYYIILCTAYKYLLRNINLKLLKRIFYCKTSG